jgi:nitrite reductase/ring-hydroxylating ferredoxin subunit
MQTKVI